MYARAGVELRAARERLGITLRELARRSKMSQSEISKIEHDLHHARVETWVAIMRHLPGYEYVIDSNGEHVRPKQPSKEEIDE